MDMRNKITLQRMNKITLQSKFFKRQGATRTLPVVQFQKVRYPGLSSVLTELYQIRVERI
jgi:hypothetical protein